MDPERLIDEVVKQYGFISVDDFVAISHGGDDYVSYIFGDDHLMHYGVKNMKWGVRKAVKKVLGRAKRLKNKVQARLKSKVSSLRAEMKKQKEQKATSKATKKVEKVKAAIQKKEEKRELKSKIKEVKKEAKETKKLRDKIEKKASDAKAKDSAKNKADSDTDFYEQVKNLSDKDLSRAQTRAKNQENYVRSMQFLSSLSTTSNKKKTNAAVQSVKTAYSGILVKSLSTFGDKVAEAATQAAIDYAIARIMKRK